MKYYRTPGDPDHYHAVPKGRQLADLGVDEKAAHEVPRLPKAHERWDGKAFVRDDEGHAAAETERRRNTREWHDAVDARLAAIEAQLAKKGK